MSNRREFVTLTASAALLASGVSAEAAAGARRVGGSPGLEAFKALQGQVLALHLGGGRRTAVELVAVREAARVQPRTEQFTLVMRSRQPLAGGSYRVEHPSLGRVPMHLQASGSDAQGALLRAEFSLLV